MLIWLIWNETNLVYSERGLKSKWIAFGIVTVCIIAIVGIALFMLLANSEILRQSLEGFYVLATAGILLGWLLLRHKRKATKLSKGSDTA